MNLKSKLRKFVYQTAHNFGWELVKRKNCREIDCGTIGLELVQGRVAEPFVVQIGACDGQAGDPLYRRLAANAINAVLVEPVPRSFERLRQTYTGVNSVSLCNAAIAREDGAMTMYTVSNTGRWKDSIHAPLWSSFDKKHLLAFGVHDSEIESIDVRAMTLKTLLRESSRDVIDYLMVDTEGFDGQIVAMALELDFSPAAICFEHVHLSQDDRVSTYKLLNDNGYSCIHDRMNSLALRS